MVRDLKLIGDDLNIPLFIKTKCRIWSRKQNYALNVWDFCILSDIDKTWNTYRFRFEKGKHCLEARSINYAKFI